MHPYPAYIFRKVQWQRFSLTTPHLSCEERERELAEPAKRESARSEGKRSRRRRRKRRRRRRRGRRVVESIGER